MMHNPKVLLNGEDISDMVIGVSSKPIVMDLTKGSDLTVRSILINNKRIFEVEGNKHESKLQ